MFMGQSKKSRALSEYELAHKIAAGKITPYDFIIVEQRKNAYVWKAP